MARRPEIGEQKVWNGRPSSFFQRASGDMAWKNLARISGRQMKMMFRKWRMPPPPDLPPGGIVPKSVMRALQNEGVSSDPVKFNARLQELLAAYKLNGG